MNLKIKVFIYFLLFNLSLFAKEFVVVIDPGHQAKGDSSLEQIAPNSKELKAKVSTGTRGISTKKYEYELTLTIGMKLKESLEKKGIKVYLTRDSNDVNISNKERAIFANKKKADMYIRLHADGNSSSKINGASVLVSSPKNKHTQNIQKESELLSKIILDEYIKATKANNRGIIYRDDLTGTNWTETPNTLLEMGFLSNPEEEKKLFDEEYQKKVVLGISNGIVKYFEDIKK